MTTVIEITPERAIFNGGQFDTNFRYLRTVASGALTTMLVGPSIAVAFDVSDGLISYRYECGGYAVTAQSIDTSPPTAPGSVSNTPTGISL